MRLTKEHLEAAKSDFGGYSDKQFALIGIYRPIPKGWRKQAVQLDLPEETIAEFVRLKNAHLTPAKRKNHEQIWAKRAAKREAQAAEAERLTAAGLPPISGR